MYTQPSVLLAFSHQTSSLHTSCLLSLPSQTISNRLLSWVKFTIHTITEFALKQHKQSTDSTKSQTESPHRTFWFFGNTEHTACQKPARNYWNTTRTQKHLHRFLVSSVGKTTFVATSSDGIRRASNESKVQETAQTLTVPEASEIKMSPNETVMAKLRLILIQREPMPELQLMFFFLCVTLRPKRSPSQRRMVVETVTLKSSGNASSSSSGSTAVYQTKEEKCKG